MRDVPRETLTFLSPAPPDRVFAYLAVPRNLILANHEGPVVERSNEPAEGEGSWSVLAFDQLRARVEYTAFDQPRHIAATIAISGFGSRSMREAVDYALEPMRNGGTHVTLTRNSDSRPFPILGHVIRRLTIRRFRRKLAALT